jgi:hypothetical protein
VASSTGNGDRTTLGVVTETIMYSVSGHVKLLNSWLYRTSYREAGESARGRAGLLPWRDHGARESQRSEFRSVEPKRLEPHAQPMVKFDTQDTGPAYGCGYTTSSDSHSHIGATHGRLGPRWHRPGPSSTRREHRGCVLSANEVAMPSVGAHCPRISSLKIVAGRGAHVAGSVI